MVTKTSNLLKSMKTQPAMVSPIGTELILPNLSGDHSYGNVKKTPVRDIDIVNKSYVDNKTTFNKIGIETTPATKFHAYNDGVQEGTVSTNGTTTLTGVGTKFTHLRVNNYIYVQGQTVRTISAINSDTSLTVSVAFTGTSSGMTYTTDTWDVMKITENRVVIGQPDQYGLNKDYSADLVIARANPKIRLDGINANNYLDLLYSTSSGFPYFSTGAATWYFSLSGSSSRSFILTTPADNNIAMSGGRNSSTGVGVNLILRGGETNNYQAGSLYLRGGNWTGTGGTYGVMKFQNPTGSEDWLTFNTTGNIFIPQDASSTKGTLFFGAGNDASIGYDGTDFIVNPQVVGTGNLKLSAGSINSFVGYQVQGTAGLGTTATPLVITTAALTAGGTQGSMTFIGGILTAQTPAT